MKKVSGEKIMHYFCVILFLFFIYFSFEKTGKVGVEKFNIEKYGDSFLEFEKEAREQFENIKKIEEQNKISSAEEKNILSQDKKVISYDDFLEKKEIGGYIFLDY